MQATAKKPAKLPYAKPTLTNHKSLQDITAQGGGIFFRTNPSSKPL